MEQPKKERSLHMLTLLMQPNRKYSVSDLAELLEVDRRTIYRYIRTFNEAGFVVETKNRHVRLATKTQIHNSLSDLLYFNQEEAMTLYNAIDAIESDNRFKSELKEKLASIYGTKTVEQKLIKLEKNKTRKLVMQAIEERLQVKFCNYISPSSNSTKDRIVEPFCLSEDKTQVWAYEIDTGQNKIFKLSRIESVKLMPQVWIFGMKHRKGFTDAFRIISFDGTTLPAKIRLNKRAYSLLVEEYPLTEKDITKQENEWIYEGLVSNYKGIGRFVIGLADCVQIETPELKEFVHNFADQFLR